MFSPERYAAAHEGAVVLDRRTRGRLLLTGADRLTYLQGLLTNDIAALTPGRGCYAALLTPQGRMISDMRVFELGHAVLLDVPGGLAERVSRHLSDFIFSEDAAVQDVSATMSHLVVIGPASEKALGLPAALRPFENQRTTVGDIDVIVAGNDEFGVSATDVFVDSSKTAAVCTALATAGVASIDDEIATVLRIEAGIPEFGVDMDSDTIPLEAGIEDRAISLTKGCYVGQEVIIRVLHRGHGRVARKLVGLVCPAEGSVPARGDRIHVGERHVGAVTSAVWSPALGRPVALGYVHRDFTAPQTPVEIGDDRRQPATVSSLPFTATAAR
jgi:folate-binding protein YgfZ